jgi:predicted Zn-dependent protease
MDKAGREDVARRAIARSTADQTEATVFTQDFGLTRFTHNAVHQNISEANTSLRIRVVNDGRTGVVTTNALDPDAIDAALARAMTISSIAPRNDDVPPLERTAVAPSPVPTYFESTAAATPEQRAQLAGTVFEVSEATGVWAAGYIRTSSSGITIVNSAGTAASFDGTEAAINVKQNGADSTGYAERISPDFAAIDARAVAQLAADKANASRDPIAVEPGDWTVVIEPPAFGELLAYLDEHFSAQMVDEGGSFISQGVGVKYLGENVTMHDDFANPELAGMPFDYQGYPTERIALVDRGTVTGIVTDAYWARKLGKRNTGHGLPAPNAYGPAIRNLVVAGGERSASELIASVERGLLISRFWYIRNVDQKRTIVTGMTRDGTFLIEHGRVTRGVRNLRFNDSIVNALTTIECSRECVRTGGYSYSSVVPTVRIDGFHFTSTTEF